MAVYHDLYTILSDRLLAIGFAHVGSALQDPPPLPAVQIYLNGDKEIAKTPSVLRELTWVAKLAVGPDSDGNAQVEDLHTYLDMLRDGFAGWRIPGVVGITEPCSVPEINIIGHQDHGQTQYLVFIVVRVIPATFAIT